MMAKLCALIVGLGVISCVLLATRQQRMLAAHQMAEVQRRVARHDRELWKLRAEIARLTTPDRARGLAVKFGVLEPISRERFEALVQAEAAELERSAMTARSSDGPSGW